MRSVVTTGPCFPSRMRSDDHCHLRAFVEPSDRFEYAGRAGFGATERERRITAIGRQFPNEKFGEIKGVVPRYSGVLATGLSGHHESRTEANHDRGDKKSTVANGRHRRRRKVKNRVVVTPSPKLLCPMGATERRYLGSLPRASSPCEDSTEPYTYINH